LNPASENAADESKAQRTGVALSIACSSEFFLNKRVTGTLSQVQHSHRHGKKLISLSSNTDICCSRAVMPITTTGEGLCRYYVIVFAVFLL
jgi:hypothetical protein